MTEKKQVPVILRKEQFIKYNLGAIIDYTYLHKDKAGYTLVTVENNYFNYTLGFIKGDFNTEDFKINKDEQNENRDETIEVEGAFYIYIKIIFVADGSLRKIKHFILDHNNYRSNKIEKVKELLTRETSFNFQEFITPQGERGILVIDKLDELKNILAQREIKFIDVTYGLLDEEPGEGVFISEY
jgi:hypothetical protein